MAFKPYCKTCETWHWPEEPEFEGCTMPRVMDTTDELHQVLGEALRRHSEKSL